MRVFDLPLSRRAAAQEKVPGTSLGVTGLGQVGCPARVSVNGRDLGTRLWRPYTFDITDVAREGKNTIKITVANTRGKAFPAERLAAGLIGPVAIRPLRPLTIQAH